jgi:hypothetical protein
VEESLLVSGFLGVAALVLLWRSLVALDRARHIEDVPTSRIRSAAQGYVELIGTAAADQAPLRAPLTGAECLWYHFSVERYTRTGKSHSWRRVRGGQSDHSFYLRDEDDLCHIHPQGADVRPRLRQRWYGNTERPMSFGGAGGSGVLFGSGRYRYTEERIEEGDPLYALGFFQSMHPRSPEELIDIKTYDLLKEWKADYQALLERFDEDGDGEIDIAEWEQARQHAAQKAQTYILDNYSGDAVHVLAKPPGRRQHFIVACKSSRNLVRSYRWQGWGMLALALIFIGISAWILLN